MTAKITANGAGNLVTLGTAAEDAIQIDSTAKTIKGVSPYTFTGIVLTNYANDPAAAAGGVPVGGLYRTGATVKARIV